MRIFFIVAKWIYMDDVNVYVLFRCYCAVAQYKHTQYLAIRMFESKCVYVCVYACACNSACKSNDLLAYKNTFHKSKEEKKHFCVLYYGYRYVCSCAQRHNYEKKYSELKRLILCFILIWLNNNTSKREWQQLKAIR